VTDLRRFYESRTVLVTGITGFKGSWLAAWLRVLGAEVVGLALEPDTEPAAFDVLRLRDDVTFVAGDVRDRDVVSGVVEAHRPSVVLHLAAQPIVRLGYDEPLLTFETNVLGTANVLEAARRSASVQAVVSVTTDKVYENREWPWGYREADRLGGADPYSASKAMAELVTAVYQQPSFLSRAGSHVRVAAARAGNVIGGGDWAPDRLVPDLVRSLTGGQELAIRHPEGVRPWQHVLEPTCAYLEIGRRLAEGTMPVPAVNIGPTGRESVRSVGAIVEQVLELWGAPDHPVAFGDVDPSRKESTLLTLDCSLAETELGLRSVWDLDRTLAETVGWYRTFHRDGPAAARALTFEQIDRYVEDARAGTLAWAGGGRG
jgi:CDP-glucose 4,6-dehydratase